MDLMRTWTHDDFHLNLYDSGYDYKQHKERLGYQFYDKCELIFMGDDYFCSPMYANDSDESVAGLLSFLSLKPGDTDDEYFDKYTPRQLEWCDTRAEELAMVAYDDFEEDM